MILQPPATIVLGPTGSGKSDCLATLIEAGLETFVIVTEPDGISSIIDSCQRRKLPIEKLHWISCLPAMVDISALSDMVKTIGEYSYEDITKIKSGVGKAETRKPAMKLLEALADFKCERDGKSYGSFTRWGEDRALCLDSLSGVSLISMALTIGFKPAAHQGEWGVAMNFIEQLLLKLSADRQCFFAMTAHIEREMNELTGVNQIMVSTLGKKLAPKIPRFFSEVVSASKIVGADQKPIFKWSTLDRNIDLKNRSLPSSNDLQPSFKPIVDAYRRRKALAGGTEPHLLTQTTSPPPKPAVVAQTAPMKPATVATTPQRT